MSLSTTEELLSFADDLAVAVITRSSEDGRRQQEWQILEIDRHAKVIIKYLGVIDIVLSFREQLEYTC